MKPRLTALLALALVACGAPPALPPPPPPVPLPPPLLRFVEESVGREHSLAGLDPEGWRVPMCDAGRWVRTPDGGILVVSPWNLQAVSASGELRLLTKYKAHCPSLRTEAGYLVLEERSGSLRDRTELMLHVLTPAGETRIQEVFHDVFFHAPVAFGPRANVAVPLAAGGVRLLRLDGGPPREIEPHATHASAGDRGVLSVATTAVAYLDDGLLLTGAGDGTVSAFDESGRRLWAFGLRGAIGGITPAGDGLLAITTRSGTVALADREGKLRWERQPMQSELSAAAVTEGGLLLVAGRAGVYAYTRAGEIAFTHDPGEDLSAGSGNTSISIALRGDEVTATGASHTLRFRLGDPHPPVLSRAVTWPMRWERALTESVRSLLVLARDDVWALASAPHPKPSVLFHWDGRRFARVALPAADRTKERFLDSQPPMLGRYVFDSIAVGPEGRPWVFGRRLFKEMATENDAPGANLVLEWDGHAFHERDDLRPLFAKHVVYSPVVRLARGPARFFCNGETPGARSICHEHDGHALREASTPEDFQWAHFTGLVDGEPWIQGSGAAELQRRRAGAWEEIPVSVRVDGFVGDSARDLWTYYVWSRVVSHFDGSAWTRTPLPLNRVHTLHVAGRDDIWAGGDDLVHFDGKAWSRVGGLPSLVDHIAGAAPDDLWVAAGSLWHGRPASGAPLAPSVMRLPAVRDLDGGAPAPSLALPIGAPEDRYQVERVRLPVAGKPPLDAAVGVASGAGVTWVQAWNRLVEVDESARRGRVLRDKGLGNCRRCALPEAPGRGVVLSRGAIHRLDGGAFKREPGPQPVSLIGISGAPGHPSWAVAAASDDDAGHAITRTAGGLLPVVGLPGADWADLAVAPDGGVFFAGALASSSDRSRLWPAGEGLLVHHRAGAAVRVRAAASLLAVAAVGPDEAWAVGAGGVIVHFRAGVVRRFALPSGEWLRAVWGAAPDDVWFGGDSGTLIHHDGSVFRPVAVAPLAADVSVTGIGGARERVWVVGPSGILRFTRR